VIVGNVISANNPEAQELMKIGVPSMSLPQALGEYVIGNLPSIVVAGTHGKTTTTSLAALTAEHQGLQPGFLIGGIPLNFGRSFRAPSGSCFVIEGDEYDTAFFDKTPKFIHYRPKHVILTSVEFDHADIYKDLEAVKVSFRKLLQLIPKDGTLVYHAADPNIVELLSECPCKNIFSYGENVGDFRPVDRESKMGRNQFAVLYKDQRIADVALKSFGIHNTLNALAVFALGTALKWDLTKTLQAFAEFRGVKRRQEFLYEEAGVTVVEDFAHHPTAVALTLAAIREQYPNRRLLAVFEPRSATSRRKIFQKEYVQAFAHADLIFLAKPYDTSKIAEGDQFSSQELVNDLVHRGRTAVLGTSTAHLVQQIGQQSHAGDVVLIMSNGGFDGIYEKLRTELKTRHGVGPSRSEKSKVM
jgi:UDP-N-acetylmuramate: L-alanyl-gamma-D-glutamyl-meso-diaminopimelate ligase